MPHVGKRWASPVFGRLQPRVARPDGRYVGGAGVSLFDLIPGGKLVQGLVVAAALAALVGGVTYAVHRYNEGLREDGRNEIRAEVATKQEEQAITNRELARKAELNYTVTAATQTRVINQVVKEIQYVTQNLESCRLDPRAIELLNRAASAVSADAATPSAADSLPSTGAPAK